MNIERPEWLLQIEGILETLNEGVLVSDYCQRIIFVNSYFEEMIGIPSAEILGHDASHFYSPAEHKALMAKIDEGMQTGKAHYEFVLPKKDGSRMPVIVGSRRI